MKNRRKDIIKDTKAITLIALIITIIILLILAGITISQLSENGLFGKARKSASMAEIASAKEHAQLYVTELITGYYKDGSTGTLLSYIDSQIGTGASLGADYYLKKGTGTTSKVTETEKVASMGVVYADSEITEINIEIYKGSSQEEAFASTKIISGKIENDGKIIWDEVDFTPINRVTISYDENGGSGTMSNTTGATPEIASNTFTAPSGKAFFGWNTQSDGLGTAYTVGSVYNGEEDLTLYAIWGTKTALDYPILTSTGIKNVKITNPSNSSEEIYDLDLSFNTTATDSLQKNAYDEDDLTYNSYSSNVGYIRITEDIRGKYVTIDGEGAFGYISLEGTKGQVISAGYWYQQLPISASNGSFHANKRKMSFLIPDGANYIMFATGSSSKEVKIYNLSITNTDETNYKTISTAKYPVLTSNGWYNQKITSINPAEETEYSVDPNVVTTSNASIGYDAYDDSDTSYFSGNTGNGFFEITEELIGKYVTIEGSGTYGYIGFADSSENWIDGGTGYWCQMISNPSGNSFHTNKRKMSFLIPTGTSYIRLGSGSSNQNANIYDVKITNTDETEYNN